MKYIEAIGVRVAELLKKENLTQTEFSKKSKISRMTINGTIKGRVNIVTFELLLLICNTLNITLKDFFDADIFGKELDGAGKKNGRRISIGL